MAVDKLEIRRLKTITKKCVKETERLAKAAGIKNSKMKAEIFGVLLLAELQKKGEEKKSRRTRTPTRGRG